jgi:hypothetical protein
MKNISFFIGIIIILFLGNCSQSPSPELMQHVELAEVDASKYLSSSAATENKQDTAHKFIRTAELKFKVKDVIRSTYDIEDIVNRQKGFVTYTYLTSTIDRETITSISADSSLVSTYYTVSNSIELRISNVRLDSTLKEIARNIDFLDYRIIKAEDVALQILSNNLTQKRIAENEERLTHAIDNRGRKLNETTSAEELLLNKQEQADKALIANLSLADQISFSTVKLVIYQQESIKYEIISNDKNITAFEPNLSSKLLESFKCGWTALTAVLFFVVKLWPLILFGIIAFLVYKKYNEKSQSEK